MSCDPEDTHAWLLENDPVYKAAYEQTARAQTAELHEAAAGFGAAFARGLLRAPLLGRLIRWLAT